MDYIGTIARIAWFMTLLWHRNACEGDKQIHFAHPFMFPSRDANPSDALSSLRCHKGRYYGVVGDITPLQDAFPAIK